MTEVKEKIKSVIKKKFKIKTPRKYKIVIHNDDLTPPEFVIFLLMEVFLFNDKKANDHVMKIHNNGKSIVGEYTHEMGEQKLFEANELIENNNLNLKITLERM